MRVAPCVGAWIEIHYELSEILSYNVAPCVGAWIEIFDNCWIIRAPGSLLAWERGLKYTMNYQKFYPTTVAPCVGAWIEMIHYAKNGVHIVVAPCVGAWIEIRYYYENRLQGQQSLPAWECGLKSHFPFPDPASTCADSDGHFLHSYKVLDLDMRA